MAWLGAESGFYIRNWPNGTAEAMMSGSHALICNEAFSFVLCFIRLLHHRALNGSMTGDCDFYYNSISIRVTVFIQPSRSTLIRACNAPAPLKATELQQETGCPLLTSTFLPHGHENASECKETLCAAGSIRNLCA